MRSKTGYAEFGYFHCYLKMDAPRGACSQSSPFPTAGQGERSSGNEIDLFAAVVDLLTELASSSRVAAKASSRRAILTMEYNLFFIRRYFIRISRLEFAKF